MQDGDDGPDGGYVPNALEVVVRKRHLDMLQVRFALGILHRGRPRLRGGGGVGGVWGGGVMGEG